MKNLDFLSPDFLEAVAGLEPDVKERIEKVIESEVKKRTKAEKPVKFTRPEAVGIILRTNPGIKDEEAVKKADRLFIEKKAGTSDPSPEAIGKYGNEKETRWLLGYARNFLSGYLTSPVGVIPIPKAEEGEKKEEEGAKE